MKPNKTKFNVLKDFFGINKKIEIKNELITYKDVISMESLKAGLERTKTSVSPGIDGQVKANITEEKLQVIHKELASQRYKPKPSKKVYIPKPDGSERPLGIASQRDKIVQASILNHLEPVLEEVFLDCSYGFRRGRNCHNALKAIKTKWQSIIWIISIDISKYFDTVHHPVLLNMVSQYCDQPTTELIAKMLKVGYMDMANLSDSIERTKLGIPQGSLISPILANLYLHSLDCYVVNVLLEEWNRGDERKFISGYQTRKALSSEEKSLVGKLELPGLEDAIAKLKHNAWIKNGLPSRDPHDIAFRRLRYVRYTDDFILGFTGKKEEAIAIKNNIEQFLADGLKLKVNENKSKIFHSSDRNIKYLGFFLRYINTNKIVKDPKGENGDIIQQLKSTAINSTQLRIPVEELLQRAVERGYAKLRKDGESYRATSCRKLASLLDKDIVDRFSGIIRGLVQYYSASNQYSDLWQVISIYRKSCALTLADKHKLKTAAKAFKTYGPRLRISDSLDPKKTVELYYPDSLKTTSNFRIGKQGVNTHLLVEAPIQGSHKQNIKTSTVCQYPGCTEIKDLEAHHLNPIKNIDKKGLTPLELSLRKKKRKTITLCKEHHMMIHR